MTGLTPRHRFHLYRGAVDFRNGFDGLCGLIRRELAADPLDGSVWIFINRRKDRMKMLVWEPGGFMLYYKRLEQGTFEFPKLEDGHPRITLTWGILVMMLEGIRVEKILQKNRYKVA